MVNPVSSSQSYQASEAAQSSSPKSQQTQQSQQQKSSLPSDTVTLKSTGNIDQSGKNP
jgi:hypothetical protein